MDNKILISSILDLCDVNHEMVKECKESHTKAHHAERFDSLVELFNTLSSDLIKELSKE